MKWCIFTLTSMNIYCDIFDKPKPSFPMIKILFTWSIIWAAAYTKKPVNTQIFTVHSVGSYGLKISSCGQRRLWSDWVDAQADSQADQSLS